MATISRVEGRAVCGESGEEVGLWLVGVGSNVGLGVGVGVVVGIFSLVLQLSACGL